MNHMDNAQIEDSDNNDNKNGAGFFAVSFSAACYSSLLLLFITFTLALIIKPENIGIVFSRLFSGELLLDFIVGCFAPFYLMLANFPVFFFF